MKNKFNLLAFLFGMMALSSCQEADLPANYVGEPTFTASADLDGLPLSIIAGTDNFYMFTSYSQSNGTYQLVGTLLQINCTDCPERLAFHFNNTPAPLATEPFNINAVMPLGSYGFSFGPIITGGSEDTSIEIAYTSPDNVVYYSNLGAQPQSSFEVLSIEDFEHNEFGQLTKKMTIQFTCDLYDADGNVLHLTNGTGTIAVAYPG